MTTKNSQISFNQDDVIAVANALVSVSVRDEYQGDNDRYQWLSICRSCEAESPEEKDLVHDLACEVLIARDLLVGAE